MRILVKLTLLFFCTAFAFSCSSGSKALQRGDYYRACMSAVERLRSDPSNGKARAALAQAYPLATADAERQVGMAAVNRNLKQLEGNIGIYDRMNRLADQIIHCPAALSIIPAPKDYLREMRETQDLVGSIYYDQGMSELAVGTLEAARAAYASLSKTMLYTPGYKDVAQQLEKARYLGTLRVIVTQPHTNWRYQLDADFFYNKLMNEITRNTYKNLVRFYTQAEASAERMTTPHQVIVLDFTDFTVGNTNSTTNTIDCKQDDVVVGTTTVNGQRQDVRGTVKARYTFHRLEVISAGVLAMRVMDGYSTRVVNQKAFANKSVWFSEWASFNGDERALTREQVATVGRKPLPLPPAQELFVSFALPLYAQASGYISAVYSRL